MDRKITTAIKTAQKNRNVKRKNDTIILKLELEMQYNVAKIINAHNDIQSKLDQSTKHNTNLKAYLKKN